MTRLHQKRFEELRTQADAVSATQQNLRNEFGPYKTIDTELLLGWSVKAKNLLAIACGDGSEHYRAFVEAEKPRAYEGSVDGFVRMRAVFLAAKEDFEGGYLSSVRTLVQAEVFTSELDQARELLASGYTSSAAVIAGVVLETGLRELCARHGLNSAKLEQMNANLVKAGAYNALVQKKITALAAIRNSAAHGKTGEFNDSDVRSMLAEVERLVEEWLR